jgi:uncharacterized protein (TIGR00725 family)
VASGGRDVAGSGEARRRRHYVGVVGPGADGATRQDEACAREVGALLARKKAVIVCGGLGGVMEAVCEGAASEDGVAVGLLPGDRRDAGNPHLTVALATGLGELRNGLVVRASEAVVCIGRSWGTLSEVALALRAGRQVALLRSWGEEELRDLAPLARPDLLRATRSAQQAVATTWEWVTAGGEPRVGD